jgi:hypothetical protein
MRTRWAILLVLLAVVVSCLVSCEDSPVTGPPIDAELQAQIDRGRYLVNHVSQCSFCHTPLLPDGTRDLTRFLAGVPTLIDTNRMDPSVGLLGSSNLTPDATGIGPFTDDQVVAAIRDGTKLDGSGSLQVHPSPVYGNMTEDDARAIVAYLRALPPIADPIPARQQPWTDMAPRPTLDFSAFPMLERVGPGKRAPGSLSRRRRWPVQPVSLAARQRGTRSDQVPERRRGHSQPAALR